MGDGLVCFFDAGRGMALRFSNFRDGAVYPLEGFFCVNTIVTGYGDDVIAGVSKDDGTVFDYRFSHCLLRTPRVETDLDRFVGVLFEDVADTVFYGAGNFRRIDGEWLRYDFGLSEKSKAVGAADKENCLEFDRLGIRRDGQAPDMGCYAFRRGD